jgi:hypothetical protein
MDESSKETSGERQSQEPEAAKLTNDIPAGDTPQTPAGEMPADQTTPAAADTQSAGAKSARVPALSGKQLPPAPIRGTAADSALPMVWSPNLGADEVSGEEILQSPADDRMETEEETAAEEPAASMGKAASPQRSLRIVVVAVALAGAAAIGSFIGSLSATGVEHFWPVATTTNPAPVRTVAATKPEPGDISALKANLDAAARGANSQLAKLAERLERLERSQAEPAAKIARVAEALDRLEKKNASAAASAASGAAAAPETTGSIANTGPTAAEAKSSEKVLPDWIVREARSGRAVVENRFGGMFDIATGSVLPGLGRVESVKRQDGQWVVVTAHGVIYSAP